MRYSLLLKNSKSALLLFLLFLISFFVYPRQDTSKLTSDSIQVRDSTEIIPPQIKDSSAEEHVLLREDIVRGERLFYGLIYTENTALNCVSCHNTTFADTLNWNPDAIEISRKYAGKSTEDLTRVLLKPSGIKMAQVHRMDQLTPEDIVQLKAYMDELPSIGLKENKPVVTNLILFILASLLLLFSTTDLIITKKVRKTWIHAIILVLAGTFITYRLVVDAIAVGRSPDYSPDQPVKFSHAVHAGQNKTDCIYCHSSAQYSKTPGIPSMNVCMNCHLVVRSGSRSGSFEIAKLIEAYENREPLKWTKVYNLPDHVFFSHAQHVNAGGVTCAECHGAVEEADRITKINDLSMGWCVNCHRETNVNFLNNKFYSHYRNLIGEIENGRIDTVNVEMIGGTECMKCHY